ncbi:MAG: hypothetical protein IKQ15_12840 [Kiritimatiellae bacterium]|nr:hypothetical protein [Kiritimatiellia bacterium]
MANLESESKSAVNIVAKTLRVKAERGYGWAEGVSPVCTKGDWVKRQHTPICRWEQPGMFYIEKHENRFADWKTLGKQDETPICRWRKKRNSDLSDACANAPAMQSNRFFF